MVGGHEKLIRNIALKLSELGESDRNEIAKILDYKHLTHVSIVLSELEKQGFVERILWRGGELQSKIEILGEGRKFLEKFVYPIREILRGNRLLTDEEIDEIRDEYTSRGVELYRAVSPAINKKSSEKRIEQIKECLRENPGMTSREMGEVIGISMVRVNTYLRETKGIRNEKEGNEIRHFLE